MRRCPAVPGAGGSGDGRPSIAIGGASDRDCRCRQSGRQTQADTSTGTAPLIATWQTAINGTNEPLLHSNAGNEMENKRIHTLHGSRQKDTQILRTVSIALEKHTQ